MNFAELSLHPLVLEALAELSYTTPTPVQEKVIPSILERRDVLALAETGSGKTAACAIPMCHLVDPESVHVQALVLVPTRELALQYAQEAQKIGKFKKVKVFALFGGEDMSLQREKLKSGVQILIATPGRLIDFIYQRHIDLSHVKTLVLDEADEMMSLGFLEDLEFVMQCLNHEHQTLLFSATMPKQIASIAGSYMKNPIEFSLIGERALPKTLKHAFYLCESHGGKGRDVADLLKKLQPNQSIIFVNSRMEAERITRDLKRQFQGVDFLHGGLDQSIRTIVTGKFARGRIQHLVATDVAARGLDFSGVTHVINLHLPKEQETYLHRAGRTARQGREGCCVTLVTRRDKGAVSKLLAAIDKEPIWL